MDNNTVLIEGFGLGNYRSFKDIQYIGPCKKINIIIGQNNSGKSNILKFLSEHYCQIVTAIKEKKGFKKSEYDHHIGGESSLNESSFAYGLTKEGISYEFLIKSTTMHNKNAYELLFTSPPFYNGDNSTLWLEFDDYADLSSRYTEYFSSNEQFFTHNDWYNLWSQDLERVGGDLILNWIPDILKNLARRFDTPEISIIPCIRKVARDGNVNEHDSHLNGNFIIDKLAELQNPAFYEHEKRERFKNINDFVKEVTGDFNAKLEIPVNKDTINIDMNNRILPLEYLGTGIQEVIILATAATACDNQVVCVEEPELHLHPNLQRKLIQYLYEKTNNQYFITTHSAHILDTPDAEIFHVRLVEGESIVSRVTDDLERFEICKDLGYRASDLIQTNAIIWVEGPSDRIYLNHWIHNKAPELKESIHYSIMFYGGRLLSHLCANEHDIHEFISLHKLNQNMAIVIDSDRKDESSTINSTKIRIQQEFESGNRIAWITEGKEIENYIGPEILKAAIGKVHKDVEFNDNGKYSAHLKLSKDGKPFDGDKVEIAKAAIEYDPDFSIYDLDERIDSLITFIKNSNKLGIST